VVGSATDVVEAYSRKVEIDRQEDVDPSSRSGSGEGEVTLIEVLDASGETEAVRARDAVTVRVHYTMNQPIEQPVFGVAGHTLDGIEVSAAISRITFIPDKLDDTGFVDMHVPALVLLPGTYDITAYITNFGGVHQYDFRYRACRFRVDPGEPHVMAPTVESCRSAPPGISGRSEPRRRSASTVTPRAPAIGSTVNAGTR